MKGYFVALTLLVSTELASAHNCWPKTDGRACLAKGDVNPYWHATYFDGDMPCKTGSCFFKASTLTSCKCDAVCYSGSKTCLSPCQPRNGVNMCITSVVGTTTNYGGCNALNPACGGTGEAATTQPEPVTEPEPVVVVPATGPDGVTDAGQISTILNCHNDLRRRVARGEENKAYNAVGQPKASNMRQMTWDANLAIGAQRLADTHVYGHDTYAQRKQTPYTNVGQNIFSTSSSAVLGPIDYCRAIKMWYDEVIDFDPTNVDGYGTTKSRPGATAGSYKVIGHYTQVVWADSYKVGCGVSTYNDGKTQFLVCNYGNNANTMGKPLYTIGEPASNCPSGTSPSNDLCA